MFIMIVVAFTRSCIWEERGRCPTYLEIDFSQTQEEVENAILILGCDDGSIIVDTIRKQDFLRIYERTVSKGIIHLAVFGNIDDMIWSDGFVVKNGNEADRMYIYFKRVICSGDLHREIVYMKRSYTVLHIKVLTVPDEDASEISVTVKCNDVGYDYEGKVLKGSFSHSPEPHHIPSESQYYYEFESQIVRQEQLDFTLQVKEMKEGKDVFVYEIPLTMKLKEAGIDLDATNPDDIFITVSRGNMSFSVSVLGWDEVDNVEIEI